MLSRRLLFLEGRGGPAVDGDALLQEAQRDELWLQFESSGSGDDAPYDPATAMASCSTLSVT